MPSSPGTTYWALGDNEGSVRDWIVSGSLVDHIVYDSFGKIYSQSSTSVPFAFMHSGVFYDPNIGLEYHNDPSSGLPGRWYYPTDQRWLSEDPAGLTFDSDPFRYVGNSPTNLIDPSGLAGEFDIGFVGGSGGSGGFEFGGGGGGGLLGAGGGGPMTAGLDGGGGGEGLLGPGGGGGGGGGGDGQIANSQGVWFPWSGDPQSTHSYWVDRHHHAWYGGPGHSDDGIGNRQEWLNEINSPIAASPTPDPPFPVPNGGEGNGWKWNRDPGNTRKGTYGPRRPIPNQSQPNASWDGDGPVPHWDVNDGLGSPVQHFDPDGNPLTPDQAHPYQPPPVHRSIPIPPWILILGIWD
ncbi:MAG TPA: RHS repeat-associated core domain-containing protein [Pirellulales bacterium]|jgi:RHS repeat-associated protein|nr:RHS repeat-associated core domain-containing protein [Pirellulales bacterium]